MKVQTKILLLLLVVVAAFIGGLIALKVTEERQLQRMGRERAVERNRNFDEFLNDRGEKLSVVVEDTSLWTDMARDGTVNVDSMKDQLDFFRRAGLMQGTVDLDRYIDMSYLPRR